MKKGCRLASLFLFELEGILDTTQFCGEGFINLQALLNRITAVDDGGMVTIAYQLSDTSCWHLGVFLSQIHRHLTSLYILTFATLTEDMTLLDPEMSTNLLEDIIYRQWVIVHLHSTLDDTLCQTKVYF